MYKIGILGLGKMGSAIFEGVIKKGVYKKSEIFLYTLSEEKKESYKNNGFFIAENELDLFNNSQIIIIAIKPQKFDEVLSVAKDYDYKDQCILSIAAGKSIKTIESFFKNAIVVRAMPNTPALIAEASTTICFNKYNKLIEDVKSIFESIGIVEEIAENQMDESLPLNGSMPAYLYLFVKSFIDNGVKLGLDYEVCKKLCCNAVIGSSKMILESKDDIDTLISNVCSKGGTTIAGLNELYDNNFIEAINRCFMACVKRSKELNET